MNLSLVNRKLTTNSTMGSNNGNIAEGHTFSSECLITIVSELQANLGVAVDTLESNQQYLRAAQFRC